MYKYLSITFRGILFGIPPVDMTTAALFIFATRGVHSTRHNFYLDTSTTP